MDQKMQNGMKKNHLFSTEKGEQEMTETLLAEMILEKSLRDFRKKQIKNEIDESLLKRSKHDFLRLTNELKRLNDL
jgi:uncharacterized protein YpiB (UPF0302 family)